MAAPRKSQWVKQFSLHSLRNCLVGYSYILSFRPLSSTVSISPVILICIPLKIIEKELSLGIIHKQAVYILH